MMSSQQRILSDSYRDARKYRHLLLAIERATVEVRRIEREGRPDIDKVLAELLPYLAGLVNAGMAFVAAPVERDDVDSTCVKLTATFPENRLCGCVFDGSSLLQQLMQDGRVRVIEPFDDETQELIPGLEALNASSAVLVRMQTNNEVRIVGVCNKAEPGSTFFLAADGRMLDRIIELVAIGIRVGERHWQQLEGIQNILATISAELDLDLLLPMIAASAAQVFDAPATSVMLWDEAGENLVVQAKWGMSDEVAASQRISKAALQAVAGSGIDSRAILIEDLQHEPLGELNWIEKESFGSVLVAPLLVRDELIGSLDIYSRHEARTFSHDEQKLAQILAHQAAVAIRNAWAYEEIKRQAGWNSMTHA